MIRMYNNFYTEVLNSFIIDHLHFFVKVFNLYDFEI